MPDISQTFAPVSGTDGRVKKHAGNPVIIASIGEWRRQSTAAMIPVPTFESSADVATSTVQPNKLKGLGDNKVSIQGIYNTNSTDATETGTAVLTNGAYVALDLMISKTISTGYSNVVGWISNFEVGTKINNEACTFSATLDVDGVFPAYGAVA